MNPRFLKSLNEKFGVKLFALFGAFIIIVSFSFTVFFIDHQRQSLRDTLINEGQLLARVLAFSSRIGVFSENEDLLKDPIEGILRQEEVMEVSIFNLRGDLLRQQVRPGTETRKQSTQGAERGGDAIPQRVRESGAPGYLEDTSTVHFWSPVLAGGAYATEESLFLDAIPPQGSGRVIGFARVMVDKGVLRKQVKGLLFKGIVIGIAFLLLGSGVTYFVVRGVTGPLSRLTQGVRALEKQGVFRRVPIETRDEIGRLGKAFNDMSESLARREEALRDSEKRLRSLSSQLLKAQEKERKRLSIELHDELGQALALLKHRLRSIGKKLHEDQALLHAECEDTNQYVDQIIDNVRRLSRDLSPSILEDLGLSSALRWLVEDFGKRHAMHTSLDIGDIDHLFSQEAQTNLYRIFQEALTNISKHAGASYVSFVVKKEDSRVNFLMQDDGKGFDVDQVKEMQSFEKGMGLAAMEERVHMLGANLDLRSEENGGTRVSFSIPIGKGGMS
ncbi:MAG: sensor histidine kinase [Deltaproteobacteria bacterium]|nr:MAG: sensor histidine kinase [Deltaproteobacteria bacterium]